MATKKTTQQKVAALEQQLAKAKNQQREEERRFRTRSLIQAGAMLSPELRLALESLTPQQLANFNQRAVRSFKALAGIQVNNDGSDALMPDNPKG
jgi:hypothetical protein